jgi:hypothetical protein
MNRTLATVTDVRFWRPEARLGFLVGRAGGRCRCRCRRLLHRLGLAPGWVTKGSLGQDPSEKQRHREERLMNSGRLRIRVEDAEYRLEVGDVAVIGRDGQAEIRVAGEGVSRRHARLRCGPKGWVLEDLGSTNGTWLGDDRVTSIVVDRALSLELGPAGMPVIVELAPIGDERERGRRPFLSRRGAGPRPVGSYAARRRGVSTSLARCGGRVRAWLARR